MAYKASDIEKASFNVIKTAIFKEELRLPKDIDYYKLYQELQNQGVPYFAFDILNGEEVPKNLKENFRALSLLNKKIMLDKLAFQDDILQVLSKAGISAAIMKGFAAAIFYSKPELRTFGDIDILVSPDNFPLAKELFLENGFVQVAKEDQAEHHLAFSKEGVHVELHWQPNGVPHGNKGKHIRKLYAEQLHNLEQAELFGYSFPVLPEPFNGLTFLLHACTHLKAGGLGLRHFLDWMLFVLKEIDDTSWPAFSRLIDSESLARTAKCITRFCQVYLGMPQKNFTWCMDVDEETLDMLYEHVLLLGNFGKKQEKELAGLSLSTKNPIEYLKANQKRGKQIWPAAQKHPYLTPFCWIYKFGLDAKKVLTHKVDKGAISGGLSEAKRRRELYKRIGLDS